MKIELWIEGARVGLKRHEFLQRMMNRLEVGHRRHGKAHAGQDYYNRALGALEHYRATGNTEFLVDAANYCLLESAFPLHPNAHFESSDSAGHTVQHE